jgi:hypothetical protein
MFQLLTVAPVPADTMRVAKDAIPDGNACIALRGRLGAIFDDALFVPLFPTRGQLAAAPWRLAVVTILQFAERLSRFRDRLIEGHAEMSLLDRFLDKCKSLGMLRDRSGMRTDSTHVLASIRNMNRCELVGKTLRATLNVLSTVDPTWVAANVEASRYLKYARRFESNRQTPTKDGIIVTAEDVGRDGMALLEKIWTEDAPPYLRNLPAVEILRQCWISQFWEENGVLRWRHAGNLLRPYFWSVDPTTSRLTLQDFGIHNISSDPSRL